MSFMLAFAKNPQVYIFQLGTNMNLLELILCVLRLIQVIDNMRLIIRLKYWQRRHAKIDLCRFLVALLMCNNCMKFVILSNRIISDLIDFLLTSKHRNNLLRHITWNLY